MIKHIISAWVILIITLENSFWEKHAGLSAESTLKIKPLYPQTAERLLDKVSDKELSKWFADIYIGIIISMKEFPAGFIGYLICNPKV